MTRRLKTSLLSPVWLPMIMSLVALSVDRQTVMAQVRQPVTKLLSEAADSLQYEIRRGGDTRKLLLQRTSRGMYIVVTREDGSISGIAIKPEQPGKQATLTILFRTGGPADTLSKQILDRKFISSLPAHDQELKRAFSFVDTSNRQQFRLTQVGRLPSVGRPPGVTYMRKISDYVCEAHCFDSVCAACYHAICNWWKCLEDPNRTNCNDEVDEVLAACGAYGGGGRPSSRWENGPSPIPASAPPSESE